MLFRHLDPNPVTVAHGFQHPRIAFDFASQLRIVPLLHGRIQGVHVHMQDGAGHGMTVTMHR
jgi:hypothetical protein